jgi:hypothetical protein
VLTRAGRAQVPGPGLVAQEGDVLAVSVATNELDAFGDRLEGASAGKAS